MTHVIALRKHMLSLPGTVVCLLLFLGTHARFEALHAPAIQEKEPVCIPPRIVFSNIFDPLHPHVFSILAPKVRYTPEDTGQRDQALAQAFRKLLESYKSLGETARTGQRGPFHAKDQRLTRLTY